MKVLYLNVYEGCKELDRFNRIIKFVNRERPDILGLSELNGWNKNNFQKLKFFQKETGYKNVTFCESKSGFHLGLFSKHNLHNELAITKNIRNGVVKAEISTSKGPIIFIVVHLSPFQENDRIKEIEIIKNHIHATDNVILMGDLNSLSPEDNYDEHKLLKLMKSLNMKKFGTTNLRIEVISSLQDSGFVDAIKLFSKSFEYSVPTAYNKDEEHFTKLRLDYIFIKNLLSDLTKAEIIRNKETDHLSDHYPIVAELAYGKEK